MFKSLSPASDFEIPLKVLITNDNTFSAFEMKALRNENIHKYFTFYNKVHHRIFQGLKISLLKARDITFSQGLC